jgi:hypothetical protein
MKNINIMRIISVSTMIAALSVVSGCSTNKPPKSGFLSEGNYSRLASAGQEDALHERDWLYISPKAEFGKYDKIMLDHVVFFQAEKADYKGIESDEMAEMAELFHQAIFKALSDRYEFVSEPGPGVMRARIAITDLTPSKPALNAITTVVPFGLAVSIVNKGVTGSHTGIGEITMELELLDPETQELVMAGIDTESGKKYRLDQTLTQWGYVDTVFKNLATVFSARVDKLADRK